MSQQKSCNDCYQKHNCQEIYQHLGNAKGPSVASKAVIAFLLPLTVFIVTLAAFETFSDLTKKADHTHVLLALVSATSAALAVVIITKVVRKKLDRRK
jgi:uncharacterized membrane protein YoaK (UPF0700 family)